MCIYLPVSPEKIEKTRAMLAIRRAAWLLPIDFAQVQYTIEKYFRREVIEMNRRAILIRAFFSEMI